MFRPFTDEDVEGVTTLVVQDEENSTGRPSRLGPADVRAWLSGVDYEADTWLLEDDGRVVAAGWHEPNGTLSFAVGIVHPDVRGRGIGSALVERGLGRAREAGAERLHYAALAADAGAGALLSAHGLREVRRFYEMGIQLDGPPPEPVLPDGLVLETFREDEARAFHDALDEAFQDHWEH